MAGQAATKSQARFRLLRALPYSRGFTKLGDIGEYIDVNARLARDAAELRSHAKMLPMSAESTSTPKVTMDMEATASDEVPEIEALLRQAGIEFMRVEASVIRNGGPGTEFPWIIYISSAAGAGFGTLLGGFLRVAGEDAWKLLKSVIDSLYHPRRKRTGRDGAIIWRVEDVHEEVYFREGLPVKAYRELSRVEVIRETESSQIRWDDDSESWKDSSDEVFRSP